MTPHKYTVKEKPTIHTITYKGRLVSELSKEELREALLDMFEEYEYYRQLYAKSQETIGDFMGDMIKLKKQARPQQNTHD